MLWGLTCFVVAGPPPAPPMLESASPLSRFDLSLRLFAEYDDNVPLVPDGLSFPGDKEGVRFGSVLSGAYRFVQTDDWQAGIGLNFIQTVHVDADIDDYNVTSLNPRLFAGRFFDVGRTPVLAAIAYDFTDVWLGGDPYSTSHAVRVDLMARPFSRLQTGVFYGVRFDDFAFEGTLPRVTSRDATNHQVGVALTWDFVPREHFTTLGYSFAHNEAAGSNFNFDSHAISLQSTHHLGGPFWFIGEACYSTAGYAPITFAPQRQSDAWSFRAVLLVKLSEHLTADLFYSHYRADADSDRYDVQRNVAGVGVTYRF
jgi:hypothetical protein